MPQQWLLFFPRKLWSWYLTLTLTDEQQEGHVTKYTHVEYEGTTSFQSKDMANVKVFVDKETDMPKTIYPRSIDAGA